MGASIGTVIAEFTVTAVQAYFVRKDFNYREILKISKNYIISSIIMFIVCMLIRNNISNNLISIILQVVLGVGVYGICLLGLKDQFVYEIMGKLKLKKC